MNRKQLIQLYTKHAAATPPALSLRAKERIKQQVLTSIHAPYEPASANSSWHITNRMQGLLLRFSMTVVLLLVVLGSTAYASSSSLPGDALYPVKRVVEQARVTLAAKEETKARLQVQFTEKRMQELEAVEIQTTTVVESTTTLKADTGAPPKTRATKLEKPQTSAQSLSPVQKKARKEVSNALEALEETKNTLKNQGKAQAAKKLDETIEDLKNRIILQYTTSTTPKGYTRDLHDEDTEKEKSDTPNYDLTFPARDRNTK